MLTINKLKPRFDGAFFKDPIFPDIYTLPKRSHLCYYLFLLPTLILVEYPCKIESFSIAFFINFALPK